MNRWKLLKLRFENFLNYVNKIATDSFEEGRKKGIEKRKKLEERFKRR